MDREIAEKIAQVANLMERASTQGEAEAAAAAMQRLVLKYGVTLDEARREAGKAASPYLFEMHIIAKAASPSISWRNTMFHIIAHAGFCRSYNPGNGGWHRVLVLGTRDDIDMALSTFLSVVATFERIADERSRTEAYGHRGAWKRSFLLGAAAGLRSALRAAVQDEAAADTAVNALVVVKGQELLAAEREQVGPLGKKGNAFETRDASAYRKGYKQGAAWSSQRALQA